MPPIPLPPAAPGRRCARLRTRLATGLSIAAMIATVGAADAPPSFCDPSLPSSPDDPLGYRQRGDRCEGRFIKEVGNTTLSLRSLVESFESLDGLAGRPLHVAWPVPPGAKDVHLRAQGLKRRLYYRMDTRRAAVAGTYAWPSELLLAVARSAADVGVLASTALTVEGGSREVYLPLRVGAASAPRASDGYVLVVMPGVALSEVFVTADEVDSDGRVRRNIMHDEALQYGYYPAERGIEIHLPLRALGAMGLVRVRVVARLESGGSATTEVWLYHRGANP